MIRKILLSSLLLCASVHSDLYSADLTHKDKKNIAQVFVKDSQNNRVFDLNVQEREAARSIYSKLGEVTGRRGTLTFETATNAYFIPEIVSFGPILFNALQRVDLVYNDYMSHQGQAEESVSDGAKTYKTVIARFSGIEEETKNFKVKEKSVEKDEPSHVNQALIQNVGDYQVFIRTLSGKPVACHYSINEDLGLLIARALKLTNTKGGYLIFMQKGFYKGDIIDNDLRKAIQESGEIILVSPENCNGPVNRPANEPNPLKAMKKMKIQEAQDRNDSRLENTESYRHMKTLVDQGNHDAALAYWADLPSGNYAVNHPDMMDFLRKIIKGKKKS